jgi:hypothetical protein
MTLPYIATFEHSLKQCAGRVVVCVGRVVVCVGRVVVCVLAQVVACHVAARIALRIHDILLNDSKVVEDIQASSKKRGPSRAFADTGHDSLRHLVPLHYI